MNILEILIRVRDILASQWPTMLIVVVFALIIILAHRFRKIPIYTYPTRESIMTPTEFKFFKTLLAVVDKKYHVFPQIHWDRILKHEYYERKKKFGAFRHINQRSVDFLICDLVNTKPLLAIELDDKTHNWESRQKRDFEEVKLFKEAGLPLLRKKIRENYDSTELAEEIKSKITEK